jgi:predicted amidophosphoribosyltransferase
MTTGHTANELAGVLRRAGAGFIEVWIVARSGR